MEKSKYGKNWQPGEPGSKKLPWCQLGSNKVRAGMTNETYPRTLEANVTSSHKGRQYSEDETDNHK